MDLEPFKLASLASTMEAIIADNWSGSCGAVFVVGESLSWRRVIKTRRGSERFGLDGVATASSGESLWAWLCSQ